MEQPFTTAVPVSSKDRRYGTSSALPQKWRGGVPGTITAPYVRRGLNAYGFSIMLVSVQPPCDAGSRDGGGMPRKDASPTTTKNVSCSQTTAGRPEVRARTWS